MARIAVIYSLLLVSMAASCGRVPETGQQTIATSPKRDAAPADREVTMHYTWRATPDSLHLYLLFSDVSRLAELQRTATSLSYVVAGQNNTVLLKDTVQVVKPSQPGEEDGILLDISIPTSVVSDANTLQLKLWQKFAGEATMHTTFKLQLQGAMLDKTQVVSGASSKKPLIRNYSITSDTLVLDGIDTTSSMQVYYFNAHFAPALPPMSTRKEAIAPTLKPLDSLTIVANQVFVLEKEGLYLLWADKPYASGLLVKNWYYPKVTMAKEMLEPLIYLTTSTERERLLQAKEPKKAVDDFWLSVAGEKHLARELIRTYYGRVEHANKLYTSHKPGWATDRGMIYLVYGPPSDISKVGNTETWIYRESEMHPYTKFVFTKKRNNFTENHYELIRHREYEESWYSAVAKWRAGITDM
ncbi:GWxTD domain-containing protein [Pontibacter fetidus]|uniref:GWxTD domain-containing protein n=1 Tax=Pontibacter fetidus TaxID=2700082 RepID=A0A6B2HCP5_9BACT|nr:GWxTD domain-containing protein [Pontibacter fetidus]NDK57614.1 GWxTD domain-containing protein [Pontibacter fetidus]